MLIRHVGVFPFQQRMKPVSESHCSCENCHGRGHCIMFRCRCRWRLTLTRRGIWETGVVSLPIWHGFWRTCDTLFNGRSGWHCDVRRTVGDGLWGRSSIILADVAALSVSGYSFLGLKWAFECVRCVVLIFPSVPGVISRFKFISIQDHFSGYTQGFSIIRCGHVSFSNEYPHSLQREDGIYKEVPRPIEKIQILSIPSFCLLLYDVCRKWNNLCV